MLKSQPLIPVNVTSFGNKVFVDNIQMRSYWIRIDHKSSGEWGFCDSSVGKESACNAGDPDLIPGSGRSAGEGIGYPLQYSWASLVAQLVKNSPTMWET